MAQQYISIRQIADDLYDHPMLQDLTFERIVNYTVNFSRTMGLPQIFEDKVETIEIHDHIGPLPCDYYNVTQVREHCSNRAFRAASDSFHYVASGVGTLTYRIQGNMIVTSIREGVIDFSYSAIPVDKDGFPMLPDDSTYINALETYIKEKRFHILFDQGKVNVSVYQAAQQEAYAAAALCRSSMSVPTVDEMETITNMWTRLLPDNHAHASGFIAEAEFEHRRF